jgi:hypothetical protein
MGEGEEYQPRFVSKYNIGVFPIVLSFPTPILREKERKRGKAT